MRVWRFCLLAGIALFASLYWVNPSSASNLFKDVPKDHFAYDAIKWAKEYDIVSGFKDGTFKPNQAVTEQQFAKLLVNYFDLGEESQELTKYTPAASASDELYHTLAAYSVPMNGYFSNTIRSKAVKRGVVAQAITHLADAPKNLDESILFLFDHDISNGQNPRYEGTKEYAKFFGATNNLTRAQVVTLFYRLDQKNFYYVSDEAEASYVNFENRSLMDRANNGKLQVASSLREGKLGSTQASVNKAWQGNYSYTYRWGKGELERSGLNAKISNVTEDDFFVELYSFYGKSNDSVKGYATFISKNRAMMYEPVEGVSDRCIIEFERVSSTAVKVTELDCGDEHGWNTEFSGTVKKK